VDIHVPANHVFSCAAFELSDKCNYPILMIQHFYKRVIGGDIWDYVVGGIHFISYVKVTVLRRGGGVAGGRPGRQGGRCGRFLWILRAFLPIGSMEGEGSISTTLQRTL
jgi:hypothetical protein